MSLTLFWYDTRLTVNKTLLHGEDERGKYGFYVRMSALEIGHITRYLTLTTLDANRLWTPDLYVDRVRQILGPTKVTYNSAFL